jgi:CRP/FNR family cyclic AMP-dependent transcriptional regulator
MPPMPTLPPVNKEKFIEKTWLKGLSKETIKAAADLAAVLQFEDGYCLFRRGDKPLAFYMVMEGAVRFTRVNDVGKEMILDIATRGATFGEISIMGNKRRAYTAECTGETVLLAIGSDDLRSLFQTRQDLNWRIVEKLCDRINYYYDSFEDFLLRKTPARIAKRILALARQQDADNELILDAGLSQENLASMLGISRQSLSKQLLEWRDAGWIDIQYGRIIIRNTDALFGVIEGPN